MSKAERYYQTGRDTILYQNVLYREFSDRAFNLLNLGVAASVAVAVVLNFRLDEVRFDRPMEVGLGIWGLAFGVLLWSCISVMTPRPRPQPPSLDELRGLVTSHVHVEDFVLISLGDNSKEAAHRNDQLLSHLSGVITRAVSALLVVFASLAYILFLVFSRSPQSPSCELARLMG